VTVKDWFNDVTKQVESITVRSETGQAFTPSELIDPFPAAHRLQRPLISSRAAARTAKRSWAWLATTSCMAVEGMTRLTGGLGNDSLFGEGGNDRYFFVAGDGQDVLDRPDRAQRDVFGPNLANRVSIGASGFDQLISFAGRPTAFYVKAGGFFPTLAFELVGTTGADSLTGQRLQGHRYWARRERLGQGGQGVDEIHGGPGKRRAREVDCTSTTFGATMATICSTVICSTTPSRSEGGYITRFRGGPGNDTMYGGTAADSYYFDPGDGQDVSRRRASLRQRVVALQLERRADLRAGIASDAISASFLRAPI
jgi:Ca2+-binding RTX toxin-like protein